MKYSLRSLMIAALVVPPLVAVSYFATSRNGLPTPFVLVLAAAVLFVSMRIALRP